MAKVITVTANTALDMFIELEGLALHDNIQAKSSREFACGKGVNVAKAVVAQGIAATCLGFVGQQSLALFNAIEIAGLYTDFTPVAGKTRSNLTLFDSVANRETHIRTAGFSVTPGDCRKLIDKVAATVATGDIVIFSGSLPPGAPDDLYRTMIGLCRSKEALALLDSSGAALREGLQAGPYLIKPNAPEFAELAGLASTAEHDVISAARKIVAQGVSWACVSLGAQGALLVGADLALAARVKRLPDKVRSHVGCGDALLAGVAVAILQKLAFEDILKMGVACGTANLFSEEPGCLNAELLPDFLLHTEVRPIVNSSADWTRA